MVVAIDNQSGQPVRFPAYEPAGIGICVRQNLTAKAQCLSQPRLEKERIYRFPMVEGPDADADLGLGRIGPSGQPPPVTGEHINGISRTGLPINTGDGAGEYPGVAVAKRFLPFGLQDDGWHP
jgi:hypothetical protein